MRRPSLRPPKLSLSTIGVGILLYDATLWPHPQYGLASVAATLIIAELAKSKDEK